MKEYYDMALESASYVESKIPCRPEIALILGTGMDNVLRSVENRIDLEYRDIPNFPPTTVKGHRGKMMIGMLAGRCVLVMVGRFHYYEGHDIGQVVFPVWVVKLMKIRHLIVTNASGGINPDFSPGDIMLINDHIGLFAPSPLRGKNDERLGPRFPDMSGVYDAGLLRIARKTALEYGIKVREGVYAFTRGPMYETPAEVKALGILGADAVGMSTVPEATAAGYAGLKVLGISCIANRAAGLKNEPLSHDDVVAGIERASTRITRLLTGIIGNWI